ncbi:MAG TPA: hypothetical protein VF407_07600, partial [Polyangiaceae bacterium]
MAPGQTLRQVFDSHQGKLGALSLEQAIVAFVALCTELKTRHDRGEHLYVHASCVVIGANGTASLD